MAEVEATPDLIERVGGAYYAAARDEAERLAAEGIASRADIGHGGATGRGLGRGTAGGLTRKPAQRGACSM